MQAIEALTRLISLGLESAANITDEDESHQALTAVGICQNIMAAAIPMARYRMSVEVDPEQTSKGPSRLKSEFSPYPNSKFMICSPDIDGILSGISALTLCKTDVRITLWELMPGNVATMITGFQGKSMTLPYRRFLKDIRLIDGLVQGAS